MPKFFRYSVHLPPLQSGRGHFPHTTAFLMAETALYQRLQNNHYGENLRWEQERVGFA